jgi:hypothetical protein
MQLQAQREMALERANEARLSVAALRAAIRAAGPAGGAERAARATLDARAPITFYRLLVAIPRVGHQRAQTMLSRAGVNPEARVDAERVDRRRRELLAGELLRYAKGRAR